MGTRPNSTTGVYKIQNIINKKQYIGSSSEHIPKRWRLHKRMLKNKNHHSVVLQRAWDKYGENFFSFEIIEECAPSACLLREQFYIDMVHPEYNICRIAGSPLGVKHTEETKRNASIRFSGKNNPFYGKRHSSESKKKMSLSLTGKMKGVLMGDKNPMYKKTHTENNKLLMSEKSKNFWRSDVGNELKKQLSRKLTGKSNVFALRGARHPKFNPAIYTFTNEKTDERFIGTMFDFRKKYNLCGDIYYLLSKKYKQYKGWILNETITK